jgi:hypothetical protein
VSDIQSSLLDVFLIVSYSRLVYAPLYPYPFYLLGQAIVIPLALKAAICIAVSCLVFPKSVNSAFIERLVAVSSRAESMVRIYTNAL